MPVRAPRFITISALNIADNTQVSRNLGVLIGRHPFVLTAIGQHTSGASDEWQWTLRRSPTDEYAENETVLALGARELEPNIGIVRLEPGEAWQFTATNNSGGESSLRVVLHGWRSFPDGAFDDALEKHRALHRVGS